MPNYKQMYFTMLHATEQAMDILIQAQKECEELFISEEPLVGKTIALPLPDHEKDNA